MKNLTWQNPEQLFVAQVLINKVKSKCCGIKDKEFWEKRDAAMKRFMASKERKRKRMAELEQMLRQDYLARTGEEPKFVNVW